MVALWAGLKGVCLVDMLVLIVAAERAVQKVSLRVVYLVQRKGCM